MSLKEFDAASGTALAETPNASAPPEDPRIGYGPKPLDLIALSLTNPRSLHNRQHLLQLLDDPKKLHRIRELLADLTPDNRKALGEIFGSERFAEFTHTIYTAGVNTPVLLRPLPSHRLADTQPGRRARRPDAELVAGERRYFGSRFAGLSDIPSMTKAMTDDEVQTFQLVENLQRDDLHPLEEAEGYQRLCEATGIRKEDIAGKIGKSRTYVYNRLKLLTLTPESAEAFRSGSIDASRAELLATVADPKLQLKALKEFSEVGYQDRRKSVRECAAWLQENILLKIKDAPFDPKDATLVDGCGACQECPKRTHSDRDLFAAFDGPDMCTDAPCYQRKANAHLARLRADAESKGMDLIAGKDAKKLKPWAHSDNITDHTKLSAKVVTKDGEVSVASVLKDSDVRPLLFVDPHEPTKTVKIVPTEALERVLKEKGLVKETKSDQARKVDAAAERERERLELETQHRWLSIETVSERIRDGAVTSFSVPILRVIAAAIVADDACDDLTLVKLWHLGASQDPGYSYAQERAKAVRRHIAAVHDEAVAPMILQILLARETQLQRQDPDTYQWVKTTPAIDVLTEETGVDAAKIMADLRADLAERKKAAKAKAAEKTANPPHPPGATSQAAPQAPVARGKGKSAKSRAATTLSPEDAQQGIAEAMQQMEGPAGGEAWPASLNEEEISVLLMLGVTTPAELAQADPDEIAELLGDSVDRAQRLVNWGKDVA